jgi:hypothetical protein
MPAGTVGYPTVLLRLIDEHGGQVIDVGARDPAARPPYLLVPSRLLLKGKDGRR